MRSWRIDLGVRLPVGTQYSGASFEDRRLKDSSKEHSGFPSKKLDLSDRHMTLGVKNTP